MDLATKCEKSEFLSFEFLAWLAARAECDMGVLTDDKDPVMEMWFEKKLVLAEWDAPHEQTVIRSDEPVSSFETKTSLRLGKWIREANIALVHDKMEWHFQVSAPELKLKGIKIKTGADSFKAVLASKSHIVHYLIRANIKRRPGLGSKDKPRTHL